MTRATRRPRRKNNPSIARSGAGPPYRIRQGVEVHCFGRWYRGFVLNGGSTKIRAFFWTRNGMLWIKTFPVINVRPAPRLAWSEDWIDPYEWALLVRAVGRRPVLADLKLWNRFSRDENSGWCEAFWDDLPRIFLRYAAKVGHPVASVAT